jgi:hypothetical protein
VQIRGTHAQLIFSDALGNGQEVDDWDLVTTEPPVSSDINATIWGHGFRYISFGGEGAAWYLRLPLPILVGILAVISGLCFIRVRKMKRATAPKTTAAGQA